MTAAEPVSLRPADLRDSEIVFAWRNDPFIVARGSTQRSVDAAEHQAWFAAALRNADRRLWIASVGAEPAGLVRFDRGPADAAVLSVYLVERFCGRGLGVCAIREGARLAFAAWPIAKIIAFVRTDNEGARRAFVRAGFAAEAVENCPSEHAPLVLRR